MRAKTCVVIQCTTRTGVLDHTWWATRFDRYLRMERKGGQFMHMKRSLLAFVITSAVAILVTVITTRAQPSSSNPPGQYLEGSWMGTFTVNVPPGQPAITQPFHHLLPRWHYAFRREHAFTEYRHWGMGQNRRSPIRHHACAVCLR